VVVRGVGKELCVCGVSGVRQASEDKEEAARIFFCDDDDDVGGVGGWEENVWGIFCCKALPFFLLIPAT